MKALSVKQPYAWLICAARKDVENRSWKLPETIKLPCRIYVHAGRSKTDVVQSVFDSIRGILGHGLQWRADYGAIIGEVTITGCVRDSKSRWAVPGQYHFLLADPVLYDKPIPYKGQLGFFEVKL